MVLVFISPKITEFNSNKGCCFISKQFIEPNEVVLIEKPDIFLTKYKERHYLKLYQIIIKSKLEEFNKMVPHQTNYLEINLLNEFGNLSNPIIKNTLGKFSRRELS